MQEDVCRVICYKISSLEGGCQLQAASRCVGYKSRIAQIWSSHCLATRLLANPPEFAQIYIPEQLLRSVGEALRCERCPPNKRRVPSVPCPPPMHPLHRHLISHTHNKTWSTACSSYWYDSKFGTLGVEMPCFRSGLEIGRYHRRTEVRELDQHISLYCSPWYVDKRDVLPGCVHYMQPCTSHLRGQTMTRRHACCEESHRKAE